MRNSDPRRLLLEGAVIVASILLAFAIDAGWNSHLERREAESLREEIRQDISNTRLELSRALAASESVAAGARRILEEMAGGSPRQQRDSVLSTLGSVFVLSAWDPVNDTYAEAIGSGRLSLIDQADARLALSRYQSQLQFVEELLKSAEAQYYGQQEPFMVAHAVYSDMAMSVWRGSLVTAPFRTDYEGLSRNRVLWNLLTFRLELEVALQSHLRKLDSMAVDALAALT
jgi:hypothetical protein